MSETNKNLEQTLRDLAKKGIEIRRLGDLVYKKVGVLPTGSLSLNEALGIGGYPHGRIVELFGPEMGGKSFLSLLAIAEAQKIGETACLIDAENSFDPVWAKKLGVKVDDLLIEQPDYGEQALDAAEGLVKSGGLGIIVIDSTAALVPKAELEGSMEDQTIGLQARMLSKALRRLVTAIGKSQTVVLFINQLRDKIGMIWGNPETTPGGRALKFYASIRLRVDRVSKSEIKDGNENIIGHRIKVKVVKNKCAAPFREAMFDIRYAEGIDLGSEIVVAALNKGLVKLEGHTYSYNNLKWVGFEKYNEAVRGDSLLQDELLLKLKQSGSIETYSSENKNTKT